ncbi:MAG: tyrosine-type recombinase/integrase [Lachnospiraceae bacterium]|nr:tyrosine-type recombinase/integrase [Lachnospiraceae bacterium]
MKYADIQNRENVLKLRELTAPLPPFVMDFFRGIEHKTATRTRIAYAYDLNVFFRFLVNESTPLKGREIASIQVEELDKIRALELEQYIEYIKYYKSDEDDTEHVNGARGIKRKIASIKSFYKYFYHMEMIKTNPAELIEMPKLTEKTIIRLDPDEVAMLLDTIEGGEELTEKQQEYHKKTVTRDLALITLLLGTGIRVSECVGLNMKDVDFKNGCISIVRKGGKEANVYFGDEVDNALAMYMEQRENMIPCTGHEEALFLSLQMKRMSVRSVENLVKKYASIVNPIKPITPHKLRSTYGTNLYRETGDIYLVADVLGHSDVNTTRKHYAATDEDQRRLARNKVKLRKD